MDSDRNCKQASSMRYKFYGEVYDNTEEMTPFLDALMRCFAASFHRLLAYGAEKSSRVRIDHPRPYKSLNQLCRETGYSALVVIPY